MADDYPRFNRPYYGLCGVVGDETVGQQVESEDGGSFGVKSELVLKHSMTLGRVALALVVKMGSNRCNDYLY